MFSDILFVIIVRSGYAFYLFHAAATSLLRAFLSG
jgi:hypothetical protein